MSWEYSENILVQGSAGNLLSDRLGWDVVYAYNTEVLGVNGTFGRLSYKEIVLTRYLKITLFENNDWLNDELCNDAIKNILSLVYSDTLMQTNHKNYLLLKNGVPVRFKKPNGEFEDRNVKVFNFTKPEKNHFLAVKEMKIHSETYRRRTDIVGFVNGIPLLFIELKKQSVDVSDAYNCNYKDYLDTIPQLFQFNAFIMLSNGLEAKIGTLGSKYEFFHEWKRLKEDEVGRVDLETMLLGVCEKNTFMDLFENFLLYDKSFGHVVKILARNHQFLGVNDTIEAYKNREIRQGKLGVFWHTQGSGKSYSMVFFASKIRRKFSGSPTFVILTDREELNKQIGETFDACGVLDKVPLEKLNPTSGSNLVEMLKGNSSFIFTLIQKFNILVEAPIYPEHDIIIISDEAHRSQYGIFADNMCRLLPTASRLGFTGTPLFAYDKITERTFGDYVSIYDFKRAVDDGATVPLYYENRAEKLKIDNIDINEKLLEAIEKADLDLDQKASLERDLGRDYHILTSDSRLETIAKDFVEHYSYIWTTGKAMFVCLDKVTAVKMFDLVKVYWSEKIVSLEKETKNVSQQEYMEHMRKIEFMKSTEMAVVVSSEQGEIEKFKKWKLDIKTHRDKIELNELDKDFKDPENPLRIVFVCAMWLTGFDVKCLSTIYIDKPLKAHTLMQTIARANRVYEGKNNGLIVDYANVVNALRKALAKYTNSKGGLTTDPTPDKEKLLSRIFELLKTITDFLSKHNFELDKLVNAKEFEKLMLVKNGANAVCEKEETKKSFEIMARELFRMIKFAEKDDLTNDHRAYKNAISEIYDQLQEKRKKADTTDLMIELHNIVGEYISVEINENIDTKINSLSVAKTFDISKIDFDRLRQEFAKVKNKNLLMKDLSSLVADRLDRMMKINPLRINYYEKYHKIIEDYNSEQDKTKIEKTFIDLMQAMSDLDKEQHRYVREGFDNDEELAIFDLLLKEQLTPQEIKKIKSLSKILLAKVKLKINELDHWQNKEETQAIIDVLIRDTLYSELPECYDDFMFGEYRKKIYEHVLSIYSAA